MTKKTIQEEQQPIVDENSVSEPEESTAFLVQDKPSNVLITIVLLVVLFVGVGFFFSYSNKPQQVIQEFEQVADTATESAEVENSPSPSPSLSPTSTPSPSYKPVVQSPVVEKPVQPSPSLSEVEGVDMRFSDVHFYGTQEPNTAFTPYRVANGSSIGLVNTKNDTQFKLFAIFVNYGNADSGNVWVHYYIDGVEVKKGLASLPGNMAKDELVTRDSAQPVMIPASGSHQVKIVIDPGNESGDVDLSNNTYSFRYTVQ